MFYFTIRQALSLFIIWVFRLRTVFSFRETSITDAHSAKRIDNKNSQFTFHKLVRYVVVRSSSFFMLYLALSKFIREEFNASFGSSFCFHRIAMVFLIGTLLKPIGARLLRGYVGLRNSRDLCWMNAWEWASIVYFLWSSKASEASECALMGVKSFFIFSLENSDF